MTGDTSTLVIQFVFLAAIILAPWFYRKKVCFLRSEAQVIRHIAVCDGSKPEV